MPQEGKTDGVVLVADCFATWSAGLLAEAGREKLTVWALTSEQEHALRQTATAAIQRTIAQLASSGGEQAERLTMQVSGIFCGPPGAVLAGQATLLQALQAGIAAQLTALDDVGPTGTGPSTAEVLGVPIDVLAEALAGHLVEGMMLRWSCGRPLAMFTDPLNHDMTQLQGQRIEGALPNWRTRCRR
jgi:hypothetical protein